MAERRQVADRLSDALVIRRPHHVHGSGRDPAPDHHDGELTTQSIEPPGGIIGAEQDERLTPEVEQDLDGPPRVAAGRHGAQQQVVAAGRGGRVEFADEVGMKGVADVHQHAKVAAPPPGQQAGRPVSPVTQLLRGLQDPGSGRFARTRLVPEHERYQPGRNSGQGRDVGQPRTPAGGRRRVVGCRTLIGHAVLALDTYSLLGY
jgi:hypothetical protein